MLLVGRQEGHPACEKFEWWGAGVVICLEQQLGHMQVCTKLQADNHASTPLLSFFTGWMPILPPNQQCQSTEGNTKKNTKIYKC